MVKIFIDDTKEYVMINMGVYVGSTYRQWYEKPTPKWCLMSFSEKRDDGQNFYMEALVDIYGNYIRFILRNKNEERVVLLNNNNVYSDIIYTKDDSLFSEDYVSLDEDIYSKKQISLKKYASLKPIFLDSSGKEHYSELSDNSLIINYYNKNIELQNIINGNRRSI